MSNAITEEINGQNVYVQKYINNWVFSKVGNYIDITYPNSTTEDYSYKKADNTEVLRLRLTYSNSSKNDLTRVERTA